MGREPCRGAVLTMLGCERRSRTPISVLTIFLSIWKAEPTQICHLHCQGHHAAPHGAIPTAAAELTQNTPETEPATLPAQTLGPSSQRPRAHPHPGALHAFGADQSPVTPASLRALTVFFSILAAYGAPVPFSSQLYTTEVAPLAGQRVCEAAWVQQGQGGPTCPPAMSQNPVLCQRRELGSLPPASIPAFPVKPF